MNTEKAGGTRYSAGKPKMWLLPWGGLLEVARVAEYGGGKYAPLDYMAGQSYSTCLDCAMRHLVRAMREPHGVDGESGLLHVAHSAWNLLALLDHIHAGNAHLDDISPWRGVTAGDGFTWEGTGSVPTAQQDSLKQYVQEKVRERNLAYGLIGALDEGGK